MLVGADTQLCLLEFVDRRMLNVQIERLRRRLSALFLPERRLSTMTLMRSMAI
jgi:hypothetical protein